MDRETCHAPNLSLFLQLTENDAVLSTGRGGNSAVRLHRLNHVSTSLSRLRNLPFHGLKMESTPIPRRDPSRAGTGLGLSAEWTL